MNMKEVYKKMIPKGISNRRFASLNNNGLTLLEILVALSLGGALIATTLAFWTSINKQTTIHERRAMFESEANRITDYIANSLADASGILSLQTQAATFTNGKNDTFTIEYDGISLLENGKQITLLQKDMVLSSFELQWPEDIPSEVSRGIHSLINFTVQFEDSYDNTIILRRDVAVPYYSNSENELKDDWLF